MLIGIVRIAHRARPHHAGLDLPAQIVPHDLERIFLDAHRVEAVDPVALGAAVAVNTAMAAAAVKVHIVIRAEPFAAFRARHDGFGGDGLNGGEHTIWLLNDGFFSFAVARQVK